MPRYLEGQIALVTGASSGIGAATATYLAQEGASLFLLARRQMEGEAVAAAIRARGGKATFARCDITDQAAVDDVIPRLARAYDHFDIVVNNAGAGAGPGARECWPAESDAVWERVLRVNLTGTFRVCRAVWPWMTQRGGSIITLSSIQAVTAVPEAALGLRSHRSAVAYGAAKAGVEALTRHLAALGGPQGIRVNCVRPGQIQTSDSPHPAARHFALQQCVPGPGTVDDVAHVIAFLASEASRFVTGQVLSVDGGAAAKL